MFQACINEGQGREGGSSGGLSQAVDPICVLVMFVKLLGVLVN